MLLSQEEERLQRTGGKGLVHLKSNKVCQLLLTHLDPYPPTEDGRQEGALCVGWNTVKFSVNLETSQAGAVRCGLELLETVIIQDFIGPD